MMPDRVFQARQADQPLLSRGDPYLLTDMDTAQPHLLRRASKSRLQT